MFKLDALTAVVTGGGQGIGEAICKRLASAGARVGVFDMAAANAERVAKETGGLALVGDITKEADVERVFTQMGKVDIVVNNAGVASRKGRDLPIWETIREDWEYVFNI